MAGRVSSPVLIGRDAELDRLNAAIAEAAAGRPRLVVVAGEAGIGKSRLVSVAADAARRSGARVLVGGCLDIGGGDIPFLPLTEALRVLVRDTPPEDLERLTGDTRDELAAILPAIMGEVPPGTIVEASGESSAAVSPGVAQAHFFEKLVGLLARLGEAATTVAVIEDVQWIDRATRDLVTFLSRNLTFERIAIVLTCRTDDLPRGHPILVWLAELGRIPATVRLDLVRLDRRGVTQQLTGIHGSAPPRHLADRIWRRSEGNPLFVEELAAAASGDHPEDRPGSLLEILLARIAGLSEATQATLGAIAVSGRPIDERLLRAIREPAGGEPDDGHADDAGLDDHLHEAIARGVLIVDADDGRYRFRHELLREVVERELLAGRRRALHDRFARLLEARPDLGDPSPAGAAGQLAHHWRQAGRIPEAYRASIVAAGAAELVHAYAEALHHCERALELESRLPPAERPGREAVLELRRRTADLADLAGEFDRAIALTEEALGLVDPATDPAIAGVLHGRLGYFNWVVGDNARSLAAHREAVRLVPDEPPTPERARVLGGLGGALMGAGQWAESRRVCDEAIAEAIRAGARPEEGRARSMLGADLVALGEVDAGIDQLRQARDITAETGPPEMVVVCRHNLALNLLQCDRLAEGLAEAQAGRAAAREHGLERRFGQDLAALTADLQLRLGRWDDAAATLADGLSLDLAGGATVYLGAVDARLAALRGDRDASSSRLAAIESATADPDIGAYVGTVRAEAALAAADLGRATAAVADGLDRLAGLDDVTWVAQLVGLGLRAAAERAEHARAARDETALHAAESEADRLAARLPALADRAATPGTTAWIAVARAEHGRARGDAGVENAWLVASEAWAAIPDPYQAAGARFRAAEAELRRLGVRADVASLLRDAHSTALALRAEPLRREIEALAARARVTLEPAGGSTPAADPTRADRRPVGADRPVQAGPETAPEPGRDLGLSSREVEVLTLVAAGLSNGEIAARLFITRKTAAVHVTHILNKLGVSNRVEAAMIAARVGLAGRPEDR